MDKVELKVSIETERLNALCFLCPVRETQLRKRNWNEKCRNYMRSMFLQIPANIWPAKSNHPQTGLADTLERLPHLSPLKKWRRSSEQQRHYPLDRRTLV